MSSIYSRGTPIDSCSFGVDFDTIASLGLVLDKMVLTNSSELLISKGTAITPTLRHAKNEITHIGEFGAQITTVSPFPRPLSLRSVAAFRESFANSR